MQCVGRKATRYRSVCLRTSFSHWRLRGKPSNSLKSFDWKRLSSISPNAFGGLCDVGNLRCGLGVVRTQSTSEQQVAERSELTGCSAFKNDRTLLEQPKASLMAWVGLFQRSSWYRTFWTILVYQNSSDKTDYCDTFPHTKMWIIPHFD